MPSEVQVAAQMDGCSRQDPAYRLAKGKAPIRGPFLLMLVTTHSGGTTADGPMVTSSGRLDTAKFYWRNMRMTGRLVALARPRSSDRCRPARRSRRGGHTGNLSGSRRAPSTLRVEQNSRAGYVPDLYVLISSC